MCDIFLLLVRDPKEYLHRDFMSLLHDYVSTYSNTLSKIMRADLLDQGGDSIALKTA